MPLKITLIYNDETGAEQQIPVTAPRFTIGRDTENNLALGFSDLSSRHAQLEWQGENVRLYDCNSQTGTWLNQQQVKAPATLSDGDVIRLGSSLVMTVRIESTGSRVPPSPKASSPPLPLPSGAPPRARILNAPIVTGIFVIVVALLAVLFAGQLPWEFKHPIPSPTQPPPLPGPTTEPTPEDCTQRAGVLMMRAIASDQQAEFFFREVDYIDELRRLIASYKDRESSSLTLADTFKRASQDRTRWIAEAEVAGVRPMLLFGIALALTDGGQNGDLLQQARTIRGKLPAIITLFSKNLPDDALLVIAGIGTEYGSPRWQHFSSHRSNIQDANSQRNIWYYHKEKILDEAAYQFALRALALGAIAQQPDCFGIAAEPVTF